MAFGFHRCGCWCDRWRHHNHMLDGAEREHGSIHGALALRGIDVLGNVLRRNLPKVQKERELAARGRRGCWQD